MARRAAPRLGLAAGARVLDTAEPAVEPHPADALLVAAQAQADVVGGPDPGLGGEVGVGDLAAHHAHQVAVTIGDRSFGLEGVLEPADPDHGQVDRLAKRRGDEQGVPGRDVHARLDHEQARRGDTDGGVDIVDLARRLGDLGHPHRIVDRRAAVDQLVAAEAHPEGQPVADDCAHRGHDLDQKAGPVLDTAPVFVGASVGGR